MARTFTTQFQTDDVADFGSGAAVTNTPEYAIASNINWLHANMVPVLVADMFGTAANNPWADVSTGNDSSPTTVASYRVRVPKDFATYRCHLRVKNAHATAAGAAGVYRGDGTIASAAIPANATTDLTLDLAINTGVTRDTLCVAIQNGSSDSAGVCSLQSITIYPVPLSSPLAAGASASGFVPIDQNETASNRPMTTWLRTAEFKDLEILTKKRGASVLLSWSDNADERVASNHAFSDTATADTVIAQVPIFVPRGFTRLEWSLQGYTTTGTGGKVKIATGADPGGKESAAFGNAWTAGGANVARWQDNATGGSSTEITVLPNTFDTITVSLKGGGAGVTYMTALDIWLKEA